MRFRPRHACPACLLICLALLPVTHAAAPERAQAGFTLQQVLDYPFPSDLVSAKDGERIAWVIDLRGARNVWVAAGPDFIPSQITHFDKDDGREITQLTFSPSGDALVFVRGGDHDANWPAEGGLAPDPASNPDEPKVAIWAVDLSHGTPHEVTEGDAPALSAQDQLVYIKDDQVWTAPLAYSDKGKHADDGNGDKKHKDKENNKGKNEDKSKPRRLFFDRGKDSELRWSPDGNQLAFVSDRDDHAFIGIYADDKTPLLYLAPSTDRDASPRWSPDG
ncbi:MAG: hypothetical protein M3R20_03590, partial [Pseudomonadota bacterium]|nr:hypothetical protein [Pseudomonadota bacterium]